MICSLVEHLPDGDGVVIVTIVETKGHTYQKTGAKTVFVAGDPLARWGNLGSLCADQEISSAAVSAWRDRRPTRIVIDMTDETDAQLGYGTYCGGRMELLVEPVLDSHRMLYAELRKRLLAGETVFLTHDLESGKLRLDSSEPTAADGVFIETFSPPRELVLFGATPLARALVGLAGDMDVSFRIIDWRQTYLDACGNLPGVALHLDEYSLSDRSHVVVLSHNFERDVDFIEDALAARCPYIGVLSSRRRRDKMFEVLAERGVGASDLTRVSSPVGIDIGARTDTEIALSILAEIVRFTHA